jgi:hypothetical protein
MGQKTMIYHETRLVPINETTLLYWAFSRIQELEKENSKLNATIHDLRGQLKELDYVLQEDNQ